MPENDDANFEENFINQQRKDARKKAVKTAALQIGTAVVMTAITTATAFAVGEVLKNKAKPLKVVLPDDYAQFYPNYNPAE